MEDHVNTAGKKTTFTSPAAEQEVLDEFFDHAVRALESGYPIPFEGIVREYPSLVSAAERLADLARSLCGADAGAPHIDGYTVLCELGRGSMGVVYLARQERLGGRPVAVKVLPAHVATSPAARARFKSEVLSVARQQHPGIVRVYDILEYGTLLAYTMEWIDGVTLLELIEALRKQQAYAGTPTMTLVAELLAARLPEHDPSMSGAWRGGRDADFASFAARVGESVATALQAVHRTGIIHRDVKPSNVLVRRDGTALLSDFGLAKVQGGTTLTVGPGFLGTIAYASPEQLLGESVPDTRGDVYSLGATLYHVLLGEPPNGSGSPAAALERVREGEPLDRLRRAHAIAEPLRAILLRAMAVDPRERYACAGELAADLSALRSGTEVAARRARRTPVGRRRRLAMITLGSVGAAVLTTAGIALRSGLQDRAGGWESASGGSNQADIWASPVRVDDPAGRSWDDFGRSVSGFGDRVLVGASRADAGPEQQPWDVGAASVFRLVEDRWEFEARLTPPELQQTAFAGWSVALGDGFAVIGASGVSVDGRSSSGAAYLYVLDGRDWRFSQRLTASAPFAKDGFGRYVSISGTICAVASTFRTKDVEPSQVPEGAGLVTVFRIEHGRAQTLQTLTLPDLNFNDYPAASVHVSRGGDLVLVSAAYAHSDGIESAGRVGVFVREAPGVDRWRLAQVLTADTNPHAHFGDWVSTSDPDDPSSVPPRILVGAPGLHLGASANVGAVLVFTSASRKDGPWSLASTIRAPETISRGIVGFRAADLGGWQVMFQKVHLATGKARPRLIVRAMNPAGTQPDPSVPPVVLQPESSDDDDFGVGLSMWRGPSGEVFLAAGQPGADRPGSGANPLSDCGAAWVWRVPERPK